MNLEEAIAGRRSVREYADEPIDEATIRRLIGAAVLAPSAVNEQPCAFTVVRDRAVLDQVSRDAKAHRLATTAAEPNFEHFRATLSDPNVQIFHNAPALILISARAPGPWIVEDCALAAENLMLAAYGNGLGSCWIGLAQSYLNTPAGKKALGIPTPWVPVAPIIVGRPKARPAPVARREPEIRWVG